MNVLVIQNSPTGPAGYFGRYLVERRAATLRTLTPAELPRDGTDAAHPDLVVVLGSARGVYDADDWIARERAFLRAELERQTPMVGICFGAQIIAAALGAQVMPLGRRYNGWIANDAVVDPLWRGPWLRWHGDRFDVPDRGRELARSDGLVMAFQIDRAVGLQFHPEVDEPILRGMIGAASPRVRSHLDVPALLVESETRFRTTALAREQLFDDVLARTLGSPGQKNFSACGK
jgi:GMP synthase (glutamine-hydrolysing)